MGINLQNKNGKVSLHNQIIKGDDGGYYIPNVDAEGNLSWVASDSNMPSIEVVNIKGKDGKDGLNGKDGINGKDGYTPVKGIDYFDGLNGKDGLNGQDGKDGQDGYTPIKGVDYFDGRDGIDGTNGRDGTDGKDGVNGKDGKDGYTPVRGVDYWTDSDKKEIVDSVLVSLPVAEDGEY